MKKWWIVIIVLLALPVLLYLLLSLVTGSFCPPDGWQGPYPPWCEKAKILGPFQYSELSYLDNTQLPQKSKSMIFGIGMNDLWGNPHVGIDMGEDSRKLVDSSMKRLSTINSKAIMITDFAVYTKDLKVIDATPTNAAGAFEISGPELKDIVNKARENNQKIFLTVNLYDSEYIYKKWLSQDLSDTAYERLKKTDKKILLDSIFPSWKEKIIKEAKKAKEADVDYLVINPTDMNFEYYVDLKDLDQEYEKLIPEIREEFKGKIGFFTTGRFITDSYSSLKNVDFIILSYDVNADVTTKGLFKDTGKDKEKTKQAFTSWLNDARWKNIPNKETYISILIPSYKGAIQEGWIEPSLGDNSYTKDWEEQAIAYDSLFRALYEGEYDIDGIFSYGYWWSDQIYPIAKDLRNDLTHSIRQKDAEKVFYRWSNIL